MDLLYYAFLALCFLAVVMLLEGLYLTWNAHGGPEARRVQRRLQAISAGNNDVVGAPLLKKRMLSDVPALERMLLRLPRVHRLDRFLQQAALDITVASFLGVSAALALAAAAVTTALGLPAFASLGAAALGVAACVAVVQRARRRRMRQIELQLPDALDLMARAMQAGHAFSSALRLVGTEGPQPIASEFLTTFDEMNFGIAADRALAHLAERADSKDLRFFVVATLIQRETGGNLAEILVAIADLLRSRQKLAGTVRVLSAESRLSAWILTLLPFALAAVISLVNAEFVATLWRDPAGQRMVGVSLGLMLLGIWWMWRLTRIRI